MSGGSGRAREGWELAGETAAGGEEVAPAGGPVRHLDEQLRTPAGARPLRRHDLDVTLFLTGEFIEREPGLVRKALLEGHEVGNHTMGFKAALRAALRAFNAQCAFVRHAPG